MTFAEKLKHLRKVRGLTQAQLAVALNVTSPVVATVESGARRPSRELAIKLSQFFDVPTDVFLVESVDIPDGAAMPRTTIEPDLLIDIMDAITEFLSENNLEMTRDQRKDLIKHFCDSGLKENQRIKDVLSGMLAAGSNIFAKKAR